MKPGLFVCQCGVRKRIAEKHIGRTVECPECKTPSLVVRNPRIDSAETQAAAPLAPEPVTPPAAPATAAPVMAPPEAAPSLEPPATAPAPPVMQDEVVLELANDPATPPIQPMPTAPVLPAAAPPMIESVLPGSVPPEPQSPGFEAPEITSADADFGASDNSSTQFVRRHGKLLSTVGFVIAVIIMVLAIIAVIVGFVTIPDKGAVVLPAIGLLLGSAVLALVVYYWLRLIGSLFVVFADIERNTRKR